MLRRENTIFLLFSIVGLSIGILTTFLLSNYFTVEDFGKLQFLLTVIGILTIFYFPGFDIIIIKEIYKKNDGILKFILIKVMPISLTFLIILASIAYIYFEDKKDIAIFSLIIISIGIFDKTNAILNAKLKFKELRYIGLYSKFTLLIIALISEYFKLGINTYIYIFVLASLIISFLRIQYSWKQIQSNYVLLPSNTSALAKEGFLTVFTTSYIILATWIDKIILGMLDPKLLAIFTIGQLFPKTIKDNIQVLLTPTLGVWSSKGFEYYKNRIYHYQKHFILLGLFIFIIVYFFVDILISHFFIKYTESIVIAQLLSSTLIFKFIELMKMNSMMLSEHTNIFNKINNIVSTVKILLSVILIPLYGIIGATASILIYEVLRFILIFIQFEKITTHKEIKI